MVIRESDWRFARNAFAAAVGMIAQRDADVTDIARAALSHPTPMTARALLNAGAGKPWAGMLIEALAQVGVAAADDVLGGDSIAMDITEISQASSTRLRTARFRLICDGTAMTMEKSNDD